MAAMPPNLADRHRLRYALEALLAPLGLVVLDGGTGSHNEIALSWQNCGGKPFVLIPLERLREAFGMLSGQREQGVQHDRLGRVTAAALGLKCTRPVLSEWICQLASELAAIRPDWAQPSRRLVVHCTHDVDRVHPLEPMGMVGRLARSGMGLRRGSIVPAQDLSRWVRHASRFTDLFEQVMRVERDAGAVATYFFMSGPYSWRRYGSRAGCRGRFRRILDLVRRYGHQPGLHGCAYSLARDDYDRQCERLSAAARQAILCHRNHYLVWDAVNSPSALAKAGIGVDSSCGFTDVNAFRAGMAHAYRLWDWQADRPSRVLEVPLIFMDSVMRGSEEQEWHELYERLETAGATGGCVAILFHIDYFVGQIERIRKYAKLLRWLTDRGAILGREMAASDPQR